MIFEFIEKNIDSLNSGNFRIFKQDNINTIHYTIFNDSSSEKMFQYVSKQHRPFMNFIKRNSVDTSFLSWKSARRTITFSNDKTHINKKLSLSIFPPIKIGDTISIYVRGLSPGFDDGVGTDMFFTFYSQLQVISFRSDEVLY